MGLFCGKDCQARKAAKQEAKAAAKIAKQQEKTARVQARQAGMTDRVQYTGGATGFAGSLFGGLSDLTQSASGIVGAALGVPTLGAGGAGAPAPGAPVDPGSPAEKESITDSPWFVPAAGAAAVGGLYLLTRR
jgi:hypothetical protein